MLQLVYEEQCITNNNNIFTRKCAVTRWQWLLCMYINMKKVVVQPTLGYHIANRQSRYITSARLKSAYTTQQVLASS